jgi:hypothetical protein
LSRVRIMPTLSSTGGSLAARGRPSRTVACR